MAEVLLLHHVQGRTPGILEVAETWRRAGHTVHAPDLLDGQTFDTIADGVAYVEELGPQTMIDRAVATAERLPAALVYAGFSMGVVSAQKLAQTRPGARGAVLIDACVPVAHFGTWPSGVGVQVHGMDADPFFAGEGDLEAARELVSSTADAELFVYPGDQHLFADPSLPSHDAAAAELLTARVLDFLATRS